MNGFKGGKKPKKSKERIISADEFYNWVHGIEEEDYKYSYPNKKRTKSMESCNPYEVKKIIRLGDTTTVEFEDGTFSTVHRSKDDSDDNYLAFCQALAKRIYGSTSAAKREQKKNFTHMYYKEDPVDRMLKERKTIDSENSFKKEYMSLWIGAPDIIEEAKVEKISFDSSFEDFLEYFKVMKNLQK